MMGSCAGLARALVVCAAVLRCAAEDQGPSSAEPKRYHSRREIEQLFHTTLLTAYSPRKGRHWHNGGGLPSSRVKLMPAELVEAAAVAGFDVRTEEGVNAVLIESLMHPAFRGGSERHQAAAAIRRGLKTSSDLKHQLASQKVKIWGAVAALVESEERREKEPFYGGQARKFREDVIEILAVIADHDHDERVSVTHAALKAVHKIARVVMQDPTESEEARHHATYLDRILTEHKETQPPAGGSMSEDL